MTPDIKLSFARVGHKHALRIPHPKRPDQLRLRAAHADSTLPPASLAPTQCPRLGHVAATNSMKAMALRAAGVSMASGLALCAPAARQSVTLRSRDELEISKSVPGGPKPNVLW